MEKITNDLLNSGAPLKQYVDVYKSMGEALTPYKAYQEQLASIDPLIQLPKNMERVFADPMKQITEKLAEISSPWLQINQQIEEALKPHREFQK